jgi:hypothetical protein
MAGVFKGSLKIDKVVGLNGKNRTFVPVKKDPKKEFLKKIAPPKPKGA